MIIYWARPELYKIINPILFTFSNNQWSAAFAWQHPVRVNQRARPKVWRSSIIASQKCAS